MKKAMPPEEDNNLNNETLPCASFDFRFLVAWHTQPNNSININMSFCVADGASAWFGGYARGDDADCLAAMKALDVIGIVFAILYAACGAYHGYIGWKYTSVRRKSQSTAENMKQKRH